MQIALHSQAKPGEADGYVQAHARIPDALASAFERVGIRGWTIWRSGDHLFHLVDCDDWQRAVEALDADPANALWQAEIGPFIETYRDTNGDARAEPLGRVWSLSAQIAER